MTAKLTPQDLIVNLARFYGSETWFAHPLNRFFHYTEGVQYFAEHAGGQGAYWLLDIIAAEVAPLQKHEPFIYLVVNVCSTQCRLTATDGNDQVVWSRDIDYTDLQEGVWGFYLADNILMLPSEY